LYFVVVIAEEEEIQGILMLPECETFKL